MHWKINFPDEGEYRVEAGSFADAHRRALDQRVSPMLNELSQCRNEREIEQLFRVWKRIGKTLRDANLCAISLTATH